MQQNETISTTCNNIDKKELHFKQSFFVFLM